jgi:hypothetical protein
MSALICEEQTIAIWMLISIISFSLNIVSENCLEILKNCFAISCDKGFCHQPNPGAYLLHQNSLTMMALRWGELTIENTNEVLFGLGEQNCAESSVRDGNHGKVDLNKRAGRGIFRVLRSSELATFCI